MTEPDRPVVEPRHGVAFADNVGIQCLCDMDFPFNSGGFPAFNRHLDAALATPAPALREALAEWDAIEGSDLADQFRAFIAAGKMADSIRAALAASAPVAEGLDARAPYPGVHVKSMRDEKLWANGYFHGIAYGRLAASAPVAGQRVTHRDLCVTCGSEPDRGAESVAKDLLAVAPVTEPSPDAQPRPHELHAANAILDRPSADPDDDAGIVARAFLRIGGMASAPVAEGLDHEGPTPRDCPECLRVHE